MLFGPNPCKDKLAVKNCWFRNLHIVQAVVGASRCEKHNLFFSHQVYGCTVAAYNRQ